MHTALLLKERVMEPACSGGLYATLRILLPAVLAGLRYLFKSRPATELQPGRELPSTGDCKHTEAASPAIATDAAGHTCSECGCSENHPTGSTPNHTEPLR